MKKPTVNQDPAYQLLLSERIDGFNLKKKNLDLSKLAGQRYQGLDLRNLNAEELDFSDSHFRNADLRGIDFRQTNIEGCSFNGAKVSGCYFPKSLSPAEISMSVEKGTRVRYTKIS
ncbi:MAG: pentapeptide repeat-containing protein [Gammaproteobacteria bacterium]|nr:pentapeptide repeat-containing protein [Gammaproteobacteria bacterium]MBQ0839680.1 pentapeptide repeat-containing protein [Gammaproteobacteria bacterium]